MHDNRRVHIARLATIELTRPAPPALQRFTLRATNGIDVEVAMVQGAQDLTPDSPSATAPGRSGTPQASGGLQITWPYESTRSRLAVQATVPGGSPELVGDDLIAVPEHPRRAAEEAIAEYADLLAVSYQCRRVLRSPSPCIALIAENQDEQAIFDRCRGIAAPLIKRPRAVLLPELGPESPIAGAVADRLDGLSLLADALSEDGPVGQVHDFFRLFERAFASGPHRCVQPVFEFLRSGPNDLSWTVAEISDWFDRLRPEVTHADRRDTYARAVDVQPHLGRMEFAAYDVLLNKRAWRTSGSARRAAAVLSAGLDADRQTLRLQRTNVTIIAPWIDPFGVYPVDFDFHPSVAAPALTAMPGYTADEEGTYISRLQIRNDYANDSKLYEVEVRTQHDIATTDDSPRRSRSTTRASLPDLSEQT